MTTTFYEHWRDVPDGPWRWPNFSPAEIACRGTGELLVNEPALDNLQALRARIGKPFIVRSAYRSPEHNCRSAGRRTRSTCAAKPSISPWRTTTRRHLRRPRAGRVSSVLDSVPGRISCTLTLGRSGSGASGSRCGTSCRATRGARTFGDERAKKRWSTGPSPFLAAPVFWAGALSKRESRRGPDEQSQADECA
jgi:Peptidase M15